MKKLYLIFLTLSALIVFVQDAYADLEPVIECPKNAMYSPGLSPDYVPGKMLIGTTDWKIILTGFTGAKFSYFDKLVTCYYGEVSVSTPLPEHFKTGSCIFEKGEKIDCRSKRQSDCILNCERKK